MAWIFFTFFGLGLFLWAASWRSFARSEQRKLDKRLEPEREKIREIARRVDEIPRSRVYRSGK